ncbi:hypothetical protein L6164_026074 [Bauhinia variegata]|nr:hypothetical protein L6164_026074 [Bauhinia variegata]
MAEQRKRTMGDFAYPHWDNNGSSIVRPPMQANNWEVKPQMIQIIQNIYQFEGLPDEDPHAHISKFLEICDTFKYNKILYVAVLLRLFPFSLKNRAKSWITSLPPSTITS